ncbi:MAG: hypothetical protein CME15_02560 [Gemmatimonadetes bacterium]|jgi:hypothetical protein|nr:hypothetical protein [Gemmatimonadota bacterium]
MATVPNFLPRPAPRTHQIQIFYDRGSYSAFPHVIRLEGDELLIAFRQAPQEERVRHTHPRSVITVMRSYDCGLVWETDSATQMAAGGGQELGLIYLGKGKVGGALAAHEVVPVDEGERCGIPQVHQHEYPYRNVGALWCWSDNFGLSWRLENAILVGNRMQACAPPVRLADGTLIIPAYCAIGRSAVSSAVLYRSDDGGENWSDLTVIARGRPRTRGYAEPVLMELDPGHLLCMLRVGSDARAPLPGLFWQNESLDGGESWTSPKPMGIQSGACPRLLKLNDGRLLLTYGRRFEPFGLYASLSEDDGRTWSKTCWLLRKTPDGDQGYTSSIELEDGRIFTTSYAKNAGGTTGITGTFWSLP